MATTVVVKNGGVEGAIKLWMKKTRNDDSLKRLKDKQHYIKPGVRRRLAEEEAKRNSRRNNRRNNRIYN